MSRPCLFLHQGPFDFIEKSKTRCFYSKNKAMSHPCLFLHQGPFDFIEKSKNPCFYSENKVRCVPYFFLAGFSKCGTSDLYARVIKHPQVTPTNKEMKWFSRRRFPEYYYASTSRVDAFPLLSFFPPSFFFFFLSFLLSPFPFSCLISFCLFVFGFSSAQSKAVI